MSSTENPSPANGSPRSGLLDLIEKIGNKLPDPTTLFIMGTVIVLILSAIAAAAGWSVERQLPVPQYETSVVDGEEVRTPILDANGEQVVVWEATGEDIQATSLLTRDGINWIFDTMVDNFTGFAPLGIVLVGMLGIGVADRTGLLAALLKAFMLVVPGSLLTPTMIFVGIMSSMALDAGYVVLPPLAAALYKSVGRSPIAGIAAVFAGVAAGFNANLLITGLDPLLAGLSTEGAQVIDENYSVAATCNWSFMIASTVLITLTGWAVSSLFVEKRLRNKSVEEGGPIPADATDLESQRLTATEMKGLKSALGAIVVTFGIILALILIPAAPLHTFKMPSPAKVFRDGARIVSFEREAKVDRTIAELATAIEASQLQAFAYIDGPGEHDFFLRDKSGIEVTSIAAGRATVSVDGEEFDAYVLVPSARRFDRWVDAIVPLLFFLFLMPGIAYGVATREVKDDKGLAKLFIDSMAYMAPIIVLAFFAGQFIAFFAYSGMDDMLAMWGGQALGKSGLSPIALMFTFILVTFVFNLFVGSMSAKYTMFAPIFIPMFMMVGVSPELTQAAYRIGDSVSNTITPLNPYLVIILVFMQKFVPKSGMGTLIATMLPYTLAFLIVWAVLLAVWMTLGVPLGPGGPLTYVPAG